jgi:Mn2+/Fe2+ NRAMP family transporter
MPHIQTSEPPRRIVDALRYIGPGLILTAGIVGTGELVLTPRVASEHGFALLWLIVLGCMVKVFTQIELGRYAVATGETTLQVLDALPGPRLGAGWMLWIWLPVFLAMISVIGGILGGTAEVMRLAGLDWDARLLVVLLGLACSVALGWGGYRLVEGFSTLLVVLFAITTTVAVIALQWTEYRVTGADLALGFSFRLPENFATAFAALGIIGVGAAELLYYPYWCLEKGYGQRIGPRAPGDPAWVARAQGWMRVMRVDAWSSMVIYTGATAAFFILGAAVLHRKGLVVGNADMVPTLAHMYVETYGVVGLWVFVIGAFATLYSTAFAGTASNARLLADALGLFGLARRDADAAAYRRRVQWCSALLPLYATVLYLAWPKPVTLILISGVGQALLLPFLGGAALFLRYRRLDRALRPGAVWTTLLWLSAASLAIAGGWQLFEQVSKWIR